LNLGKPHRSGPGEQADVADLRNLPRIRMHGRGWGVAALLALVFAATSAGAKSPSYQVSARIPAPDASPDASWDYATLDASHGRLLVNRGDGVLSLEVGDDRVKPIFVAGAHTHATVVTPRGRLVVTNGADNTALLADAGTGRIIGRIAVGQKPDAAVFDPASGLVFVMDAGGGDIALIDPAKAVLAGRISVPGKLEFAAVDGHGRLFVNVEDSAEIAVIDTRARRLIRRWPIKGCEGPTGLAFVSAHRVLITSCANRIAKVLDSASGREVGQVSIGPSPDAVLYDARRDLVAIASAGSLEVDGELTLLTGGGKLLQRVPTQRGARTVAEDVTTGRFYLPVATYRMGPDGQPQTVAGTFVVLVVSR
jgi:hypothetical protein